MMRSWLVNSLKLRAFLFVFDQRIALAGAQPRDVFIQVFDRVLKTQQETSINQPEDGVVCTDENCEIPDQK